jgi:acyl carrier protein
MSGVQNTCIIQPQFEINRNTIKRGPEDFLMTRDQIVSKIVEILNNEFEISDPGLDENLTEKYEFDSIDAIALLEHVEDLIRSPLTQEEKKQAMEIRTINQICDYIERMLKKRI